MKQDEFLNMLNKAYSVTNYYSNKFPYNLGHYDGGAYSFDCWNLIKVILAGWKPTGIKGSYTYPNVTGDIDGYHLLLKCTNKSKDFSKLIQPGAYLYLSTSPHSGIYVGDKVIDGKTYNVIECTKAWNSNGVIYSYVDERGRRLQYKGGKQSYSWTDWGLLPWIEYEDSSMPVQEVPEPDLNTLMYATYTVKKGNTLSGIASKYNTKVDSILQVNPKITDPNKIYIGQEILIPVSTQQVSTPASTNDKVYHTVQKGDTLSGIAKKYNTNYIKLATVNGIVNPNKIYIGQQIRVK